MDPQDMHRVRLRRRAAVWALVFAIAGGAGLIAARGETSASVAAVAGPAGVAPAQDPLADAFTRVCWNCHDPDRIRQSRRTRVEWEDVIFQMIDRGAVGSDQDFSLVLQYLLRDYGRVNVNQAMSEELALVLGLSPKEAETIVAHREANGAFKDFEGLAKVPDVDAKKLEARRAAILF